MDDIKIYTTRHGNLSIPLCVDGKQTRIRFVTPVQGISTWQAAREYLCNPPYSEPKRGLNTPEKICSRAKKLGLFFPEIKE